MQNHQHRLMRKWQSQTSMVVLAHAPKCHCSPHVRRVELWRRNEHTCQGLPKFRCVRALAVFVGLAEARIHCSKNSMITRPSSREKNILYECSKCKCLISICFVLWYRQRWNFNFRIGNPVVQFQWCITAGILHVSLLLYTLASVDFCRSNCKACKH